jgi:hypothetical protein
MLWESRTTTLTLDTTAIIIDTITYERPEKIKSKNNFFKKGVGEGKRGDQTGSIT